MRGRPENSHGLVMGGSCQYQPRLGAQRVRVLLSALITYDAGTLESTSSVGWGKHLALIT